MIPIDLGTLDDLLASPRLLLFKHSPRCGLSRWALDELEPLDGGDDLAPIALVDVVADRELAVELADRTGVRHQSPQLLYLAEGRVRGQPSHGAIPADAVRRRLAAPDRV